jgi:hypothetical protein
VFVSALEQSERLMWAAADVDPSASPLLLFYAVSQAGRAIAAARLDGPVAAVRARPSSVIGRSLSGAAPPDHQARWRTGINKAAIPRWCRRGDRMNKRDGRGEGAEPEDQRAGMGDGGRSEFLPVLAISSPTGSVLRREPDDLRSRSALPGVAGLDRKLHCHVLVELICKVFHCGADQFADASFVHKGSRLKDLELPRIHPYVDLTLRHGLPASIRGVCYKTKMLQSYKAVGSDVSYRRYPSPRSIDRNTSPTCVALPLSAPGVGGHAKPTGVYSLWSGVGACESQARAGQIRQTRSVLVMRNDSPRHRQLITRVSVDSFLPVLGPNAGGVALSAPRQLGSASVALFSADALAHAGLFGHNAASGSRRTRHGAD